LNSIWKHIISEKGLFYKSLLILSSSILILYIFPLGGQFKYEFQKGRVWQYPDFYSPFDFSILKSDIEYKNDQEEAVRDLKPYLRADLDLRDQVIINYSDKSTVFFKDKASSLVSDSLYTFGKKLIDEIYTYGVLPPNYSHKGNSDILLIQEQLEIPININELFKSEILFKYITTRLNNSSFIQYEDIFKDLFFEIIAPNISIEKKFYETSKQQMLQNISRSRGFVASGELIVAKGELVNDDTFEKLSSLRNEYTLQKDDKSSIWIQIGYSILIVLIFTLLLLFIYTYRVNIYKNNRKLTFIFFNILTVITAVTLTVNYNTDYVFAVPICILPLIMKAFFDARLGLFTHVLTVLLIGFIVPNSFEFVFLQIMAGIVTILSVSELYKRANLFISVGQIILIYLIGYFAFFIIHEGGIDGISLNIIVLFVLNGVFTLFVQPLIYLFEKLFNLVSDVSLLELSDTNSDFFKDFSDKAPGTFHHSLQVANLAESAASIIGANALLTRVGALYHDIGKIGNPIFFSENQRGSISPHNDITPKESTRIIINHVIKGVELAKKINLPDRVVDFIRTHHGTSKVYFFFKKQEELYGEAESKDFSYSGPKPFSKETAILMMADSVEAASKSLKEPTIELLKDFVNKIVDQQMDEKQFMNSNITLSDIELVKKVFIDKLINIYHLRIEYPE
jgi:putative nucleotidyltransferase with HDIG domain